MDPKRLEEIKARVEKATPGPWRVVTDGEMPFDGQEGALAYMGDDGGDGPAVHVSCSNAVEARDVVDDAAFVAAARQDIPDILAEVERLRSDLGAVERRSARERAEHEALQKHAFETVNDLEGRWAKAHDEAERLRARVVELEDFVCKAARAALGRATT